MATSSSQAMATRADGKSMTVRSAVDTLKSFGVSPSPLERLALTMVAATRDVSTRAQVKEAYGDLDAKSKAELKHGRIAMLAALGIQVADVWHPLWSSTTKFWGDAGPYISAVNIHKEPLLREKFWPLVFIAAGLIEFSSGVSWTGEAKREPGDLGFDPLNLRPTDPKEWLDRQNQEISNGRLAMFAAIGMLFQELTAPTKEAMR